MSNARNRRDKRRPRSRSISPQLFTNNKRDLRNDLRNNLRHRSRSRSPRITDDGTNIHFREQRQYSPTNNFRNKRNTNEEQFYMEQHREEQFFHHENHALELLHRNRRNFRSRSKDNFDKQLLNFEPCNSQSKNTRYSPPEPRIHSRHVGSSREHYQQAVVYPNEIDSEYNKGNSFGTTAQEQLKSNISWQPPPEDVILITDPQAGQVTIDLRPFDKPLKEDVIEIPTFDPDDDGFNSKQYIATLDELSQRHKWNEEELKFNFVTHLAGRAKTWQINTNRIMNPWNNVKRTFINTFPSQMDYHKRLKDMMLRQMTSNESLKTYFMHKTMLLNQTDIFERRAVSCIIAGMQQHSDDIKEAAISKNFGTAEELLAYITEIDTAKKTEAVITEVPSNEQTLIPPLLSEAGILQAQQIAKQRLQSNAIIYNNRLHDGHLSKDCLTLTKRQIVPKHCLEVSINGLTFPAYNDLSSSCVTMRESDAKKANVQFQRHITCIRGFGNASVTALGEARVIIRVDKVMLSFEVVIVPNAAQDVAVVIGRNFRSHPDVRYIEAEMGISFTQIVPQQSSSSFAANERLMATFNSGGKPRNNQQSNRQNDKQRRRY